MVERPLPRYYNKETDEFWFWGIILKGELKRDYEALTGRSAFADAFPIQITKQRQGNRRDG